MVLKTMSIITDEQVIEDDYFLEPLQEAIFIHQDEKNEARRKDGLVHVSDILDCPRRKVFEFIENIKPDPRAIYYFTIGEAIHNWIEHLLVKAFPSRYTTEMDVKVTDYLIAHPDIYDIQHDRVIELKTTEKVVSVPYPVHIKQLKTYMAALGKPSGDIIYFMYNKSPYKHKEDALKWYKRFPVDIDDEEAYQINEHTKTVAQAVYIARQQKNPAIAPHIRYDKDQNEKCKWCPFYFACDKMIKADEYHEKLKLQQNLEKQQKPLSLSYTRDQYDF